MTNRIKNAGRFFKDRMSSIKWEAPESMEEVLDQTRHCCRIIIDNCRNVLEDLQEKTKQKKSATDEWLEDKVTSLHDYAQEKLESLRNIDIADLKADTKDILIDICTGLKEKTDAFIDDCKDLADDAKKSLSNIRGDDVLEAVIEGVAFGLELILKVLAAPLLINM